MNRTLDYVPRLVEANRAYRVTADDYGTGLSMRSRYWTPGYPVLDQGAEGACVGFGCTGEAMASPVRVKVNGHNATTAEAANRAAAWVYNRAKEIDEWEGVDYEGTSVRAGMLVGRERGWWSGFRWAFNMLELRAALEDGPVVVGTQWFEDMYEAPRGILKPGGEMVGWHCYLITGSTPRSYRTGKPSKRMRNSWGLSFGINGSAEIADEDLDRILFQAGGEAAVVVGRAM